MTQDLSPQPDNDIIAAIATAQGPGGIGIVRLSGVGCIALADKIFAAHDHQSLIGKPGYSLTYGRVTTGAEALVIDEALATIMRAPRSYTKEDVVELNVHGGPTSLRRTLELALAAGARLAEPGEFTRRAFLNGRIDLTQAEAVLDLIEAKSKRAGDIAIRQLTGRLARRIQEIETTLTQSLVDLEAAVDFSDEDIEIEPREKVMTSVDRVAESIDNLLAGAADGEVIRTGARLAIIGRPNVGKSSLLNALLRRDRAIVTPLPGTTRDVLEETISIDGVAFVLIDTAGIRHTDDVIEKQGVARSRRSLAEADLAAVVVDAVAGVGDEDLALLAEARALPKIVIANKIDLLPQAPAKPKILNQQTGYIGVSAKTGMGIDRLERALIELVFKDGVLATDGVLVSNARHAEALRRTAVAIAQARTALSNGLSEEFAAGEIRTALSCVGEISGRDVSPDILDRIFERFCIGK